MEKEEKIDVKLKDGHLNPKLFKAIFTADFLNFLNEINEKEDVANIIDRMNNWMIENTYNEGKELEDSLLDVVLLYAMALVGSFQAYQKYNDGKVFSEYTKQ